MKPIRPAEGEYQIAWDKGFNAYHAGRPIEHCPYITELTMKREWLQGWCAAELEQCDHDVRLNSSMGRK